MGIRFEAARAAGAVSSWALKRVAHRPAANFPGKLGLCLDPALIGDLRGRLAEGSVCIVGTNGKTTVSNMLADALEAAGRSVVCNRTGANLDSGVATTLLHAHGADWGVFECDELWLAKILPGLQSRYVVLLNLFRDQLDRMGEIDHIQESIAAALADSPATTLVYNADDPLCAGIAARVPNPCIGFGVEQAMGLVQNTVADASMCQSCGALLDYAWRQYGQLGSYRCPACGFARPDPRFRAAGVRLRGGSASFEVVDAGDCADVGAVYGQVESPFPSAYMAYNVLAACAAACCCGVPFGAVERAIAAFDPQNGRLQAYRVAGRRVLLNLAKNPTGFNQNLRIVQQCAGPAAVAFFINDKEADGHDVSWLWDVDFQELASKPDLVAFAGGIRGYDMQVRLKYAGVESELVEGVADALERLDGARPGAQLFVVANYTALPAAKAELDALQTALAVRAAEGGDNGRHGDAAPAEGRTPSQTRVHAAVADPSAEMRSARDDGGASGAGRDSAEGSAAAPGAADARGGARPLAIAHVYPSLLNLYGDGGNVTVLERRCAWRGIPVRVERVELGQEFDFDSYDLVFLGGGPDREQRLASQGLLEVADAMRAYVEDDGVLLAICGGYQIIGREWVLGERTVEGLGLVDIATGRAPGGSHNRLVGNVALESPLATLPVIGYENHAGRTYLGEGCEPFGRVLGRHGRGNNDRDRADGVLYRNVVGTYLHGPLLAKNPQVADALIERALARCARKAGCAPLPIAPLDDAQERAANGFMRSRLHVYTA